MDTINEYLKRLSLEEKIAQLTGLILPALYDFSAASPTSPGGLRVAPEKLVELRPHGLGHLSLAWFHRAPEQEYRDVLDSIQKAAREVSRFGIGVLIHAEGINGLVHGTGIPYPTAWAQATTWMPDLIEASSAITSEQMRGYGIQLCFSPVLDLARDPRWGRVHETYGEDPELASQIGIGFIRGINGPECDSGVQATGKHFLGYALSEGGLNQARSTVGHRALVDEYAEPFRRAIAQAGLSVIMNSYNDVDGTPVAANRWILTDLLRGQLGFKGLVVGDYDAVKMLVRPYHVARNAEEAGAMALNAGLDVELPGDDDFSQLSLALDHGLITEESLDLAVTHVLEAKREAGLLPDLAPTRPHRPATTPDRDKAKGIAREIAVNATTLLQNDGILPLAAGMKIAVVGSLADELRIHFGAYTDVANDEQPMAINMIRTGQVPTIDPATFNFTDIFQARIPGIATVFEAIARSLYPGAETILSAMKIAHKNEVTFVNVGSPDSDEAIDRETLRAAVAGHDVVIAVVGERTGWVGNNSAGEGQSSATLELPGNQAAVIDALADLGVPLVTVVIAGRPIILTAVAQASAAVILAPLLGGEGPQVVADVLTGTVEPGGRLPSTFPRHVGQIPLYHGHPFGSGYAHPTGSRHPYNDLDPTPLYPFGHGLGYTTIDLSLDEVTVCEDTGTISAFVTATNTGTRSGSTVVQLYARDEHGSVVRPVRQLAAFQRVCLEPGTSQQIDLTFPIDRLVYSFPDGHRGIEEGEITVMMASSSATIHGEKTITVAARQVAGPTSH
ncbi:MAG: glycoside hydrolase family 3 C-terminal domain-containing protein [Propionibacteriaceae bacterium]|jgi:beta-glucosidase|nr:glycoside hydrolase family 3 C-terminal domain-containing protein [Propionibacteriaceae bacterium]